MDEPWVWAIIVIAAVVLFGSKRLPDAARGIGRSLRIFKTEFKGLADDQSVAQQVQAAQPVTAQPVTAQPVTAQPVTAQPVPAEPQPVAQQPDAR